jgi:hypothetical protein
MARSPEPSIAAGSKLSMKAMVLAIRVLSRSGPVYRPSRFWAWT